MTPLKLIFMGTPAFAVPTLQALIDSPHEVAAVYSQPPRPSGRGQKETPSAVHQLALARNIPVFTPKSLKKEKTQAAFKALGADAAIVAAYGLLLPKAILEGTRLGCINVHPSLLPRWRGAAPLQRTVMAGDTQTGVCIMQMDEGLDTGDVLLCETYEIYDGMNTGELHDVLANMAGPLVLQTLEGLDEDSIMPIKQSEIGATYAPKITKEECRINWNLSAAEIRQKILGLSPYPGAFFVHKGENIKVFDAELYPDKNLPRNATPGETIDDYLTIACAEGALCHLRVQRPGKKPMDASEMLKGYAIASGTVLE